MKKTIFCFFVIMVLSGIFPFSGTMDCLYIVYLKACIEFSSMHSPSNKEYVVDTVNDSENNLSWTKDIGEHLVYDGSTAVTVKSRLDQLNRSLSENERNNRPWSLITKNDLEKLLKRQDMRDALNIRLNRNYWTSKRFGIYYLGYQFQEEKDGSLVLKKVRLISSDGAFCIFVREMN